MSTVGMLPTMDVLNPIIEEITCRAALLNCLTINYADFWQAVFSQEFAAFVWTKWRPFHAFARIGTITRH